MAIAFFSISALLGEREKREQQKKNESEKIKFLSSPENFPVFKALARLELQQDRIECHKLRSLKDTIREPDTNKYKEVDFTLYKKWFPHQFKRCNEFQSLG